MVYGDKRRVVTFQLDSELRRNLFELSKQLNFNAFVMDALTAEYQRRTHPPKSSTDKSALTVKTGGQ